jgi:hypothetical protein
VFEELGFEVPDRMADEVANNMVEQVAEQQLFSAELRGEVPNEMV